RPRRAMLLLSVAPDVKINSDGPASNTPASCSLACWTARLALVPQSWVRLPALPNSLVIQWRTTSATRGSTRVVAAESRYALMLAVPLQFADQPLAREKLNVRTVPSTSGVTLVFAVNRWDNIRV